MTETQGEMTETTQPTAAGVENPALAQLLDYLIRNCRGSANARQASRIIFHLGIPGKDYTAKRRKLSTWTQSLRNDLGEPVVSSDAGKVRGYFLATTLDELDRYMKQLTVREIGLHNSMAGVRRCKKKMLERRGSAAAQTSLF